ncbi:tRNA lysidine(34) synthetase TilS [Methylococcus sp. EFPC2]|uniref:tRNA lysidine(34) synthetase TilS n=1 Tax=Methylococcus sp. EFPC2 TaxID=2812648 RepID=UPI00196727F7|nr:tRNA lysidine(34) synthetase TilS [Methylococcus sp. EFPC2]QSA95539.1 tRNA lysidine(34) synthetase TilS [Methylococcus sp. EFPC2]
MAPTVAEFGAQLALAPPPRRYLIAYSGGLDSHVLLHLYSRLRATWAEPPGCQVLHVHHGLQDEADAWVEHCARVCRELSLPFQSLYVDARARQGDSPEEAARDARYRALQDRVEDGDVLLIAQHQDDQAETLLLQLLRGAGLAGLAAMPKCAPFGSGYLLRPLLDWPRTALQEYAEGQQLRWIEDPSNADASYDRNFLRLSVIPLLKARWPAASKTLSRSAGHCAEALHRLEHLARDLYLVVLNEDKVTLSVSRLLQLEQADRRWVLRQWLRERGYRLPAAAALERLAGEMLLAREDKMPVVAWPEGEVRRYRDALYLRAPAAPQDTAAVMEWNGTSALELPDGNGILVARSSGEGGIALDAWRSARITVRYRQGGEVCRLPGRAGSHALKKLLQEAGIPPWERTRLPLIELNGALAAIADRWVCDPFQAAPGRPAIRIEWESKGGSGL